MVSKSDIDKIKASVSIKDYVNEVIVKEIDWYYKDYTVDLDNKPYIKCPLHGEDTPSFRVYDDTNTFYCFGCGAGGDVLKLHRLFIKALNNYDIGFIETVEFFKSKFSNTKHSKVKIKSRKHIENLNKDILKLDKFYKSIENTLKIENSLSEDKKHSLYEIIDDTLSLVKLKKISAVDALEHLKSNYYSILGG